MITINRIKDNLFYPNGAKEFHRDGELIGYAQDGKVKRCDVYDRTLIDIKLSFKTLHKIEALYYDALFFEGSADMRIYRLYKNFIYYDKTDHHYHMRFYKKFNLK